MNSSREDVTLILAKKWVINLFSIFSAIIFSLGLILSMSSLLGGFLIVLSGSIFFPKVRLIVVDSGFGGSLISQRNLKIIATLFLFTGFVICSSEIRDVNFNEWSNNKQKLISKIESDIQKNNLEDAKQLINKFKSAVKNDLQFDGLVAKYQVAKDKNDADLANKKADEKAAAEKLAKDQALAQSQKEASLTKSNAEKETSSTNNATSSFQPSSGTVTRIDTSTGNVAISGFTRVTVGKGTSITVNGSRVKNEGDLMVGDRCTVRMESYDLYAQNLVCSR